MAAAAVEAIIQKNRTADLYTRIKGVMKPSTGGSLQHVDIPKRDKDSNIILDEDVLLEIEAIHKALLARNKKHFHQADDTPFAGGSEDMLLYDLIGYTGISKGS
jgi:hypothetical protein